MGLFSKKEAPAASPKQNPAAYIVKEINTMSSSNNYEMIYGMLCFAFDFEMIDYKERQALTDKLKQKADELAQMEKVLKKAQREEMSRIIAEHKAKKN